jgi:nitrate reductase cytochrome c-type subunit
MRKRLILIMTLCASFGALCAWAASQQDCPDCPKSSTRLDPNWREFVAPPLAPGELPDCHRVQFGKQNCRDCHKKETPDGYNQWLGSKHGINNVKCGVCHGDVKNYRARPDKRVCIGCHSEQVKRMPAQSLVTNCSFCHKGHWFTVHKIDLYERFSPENTKRFNVPGF